MALGPGGEVFSGGEPGLGATTTTVGDIGGTGRGFMVPSAGNAIGDDVILSCGDDVTDVPLTVATLATGATEFATGTVAVEDASPTGIPSTLISPTSDATCTREAASPLSLDTRDISMVITVDVVSVATRDASIAATAGTVPSAGSTVTKLVAALDGAAILSTGSAGATGSAPSPFRAWSMERGELYRGGGDGASPEPVSMTTGGPSPPEGGMWPSCPAKASAGGEGREPAAPRSPPCLGRSTSRMRGSHPSLRAHLRALRPQIQPMSAQEESKLGQ